MSSATIIAHCATAAEEEIASETGGREGDTTSRVDKVVLTERLVEGSNLCQELENMVSFVVTQDSTDKSKMQRSPAEHLVALARDNSLVAHGVVMWARNMVKGNDFVSSGTYATVSPSLLSLVRVLYMNHKSLRDDSIEVVFNFLSHSNVDSDVSYQKLTEIKEQSLRLLLVLCVNGEAPTALVRMTSLLEQPGNSAIDSSLIRYFVSGLVDVIRGPFSAPFTRILAAFLREPVCVEALKTSYFETKGQMRLTAVLDDFRKQLNSEESVLNPEDADLVRSLLACYTTTTTSTH